MKSRVEYKDNAKSLLQGKYQNPIIVLLVFGVVEGLLQLIYRSVAPEYDYSTMTVVDPGNPTLAFIVNVISFVVGAAIVYSITRMFIQIARDEEFDFKDILLVGFKEDFVKSIVLQFLQSLFTVLWTLLFIIPGFIKVYSYSMSFYLINKEPKLESLDAITKSRRYMDGSKLDLFILDLSYLGWYILSVLTAGILLLWVVPKHMTARTLMFEDIYARYNISKEETVFETLEG